VKAGSYLRAEIEMSSGEPAPIVDRSALFTRDGRSYVFRLAGDTVERVPVRVGITNAERAQILGGLAAGDEVVRGDAVERLEGGAQIQRIEDVSARSARAEATP
jgi:multidrug efflux pump subunit AcrA (membrane-fusion protein)